MWSKNEMRPSVLQGQHLFEEVLLFLRYKLVVLRLIKSCSMSVCEQLGGSFFHPKYDGYTVQTGGETQHSSLIPNPLFSSISLCSVWPSADRKGLTGETEKQEENPRRRGWKQSAKNCVPILCIVSDSMNLISYRSFYRTKTRGSILLPTHLNHIFLSHFHVSPKKCGLALWIVVCYPDLFLFLSFLQLFS